MPLRVNWEGVFGAKKIPPDMSGGVVFYSEALFAVCHLPLNVNDPLSFGRIF